MQLRNLAPHPRHCPLPGLLLATPSRPGPRQSRFRGECVRTSQGLHPSARGQVQRAPGRGRVCWAPLTFGCLLISGGRCSAWLGHVLPRTLASLARHGALGAEHPRQRSPGSCRRRIGSGDLASCLPAARPLHCHGPGPPGPAGPRAAARVPPAPAQRRARGGSGSAGSGDARALARSRRGGASHSHPAPCSSDVLIYCNCLRRDPGVGPGGGGGEVEGAGRESWPLLQVPATLWSRRQRTEERAPGAARQQPVRSPATEAGGAPGPVGRGWGGGGPGRVRGAGARRVEEPLQPEPDLGQEEEKEEVLEEAAGSRLRAELHCHILGFLGCRRRCEAPGTC